MQLSLENPDFTRCLHKQATSSTSESQLTRISLASKPTCLENEHSKHNPYKSLGFAGGTFAIEEQERGYWKSLCCFLFPTKIHDYSIKIKPPV